jgi:sugar lactone lactonase YvrE
VYASSAGVFLLLMNFNNTFIYLHYHTIKMPFMRKVLLLVVLLLPFALFGQSGVITTIAGNGQGGFSGDNGPALSAQLGNIGGMCFDRKGNLYIVQGSNQHRIRKVDATGIITTFAGTGVAGYSGDNGPATLAKLYNPFDIVCDSIGNIYISDAGNYRIRKVDTFGIITTFAGNGTNVYGGDNGPAISAGLYTTQGVCFDKDGNLYIACSATHRIRKVDANGVITTVAGNGNLGFSGDNGLATNAEIKSPFDVAADSLGNFYIADYGNVRVRKVNPSGIITTIAGNGSGIFNGDNVQATTAAVTTWSLALDKESNLYVADRNNDRIRKVNLTTGLITTVAGTGIGGYSGDNGLATSAQIDAPQGLTMDRCGDLYISEINAPRVRRVDLDSCKTSSSPTHESISISTQNDFSIYPNPANDVLHIGKLNAGAAYTIYNVVGSLQQQDVLRARSNEIDISSLPVGVYVVEVKSDGMRMVRRFVKR